MTVAGTWPFPPGRALASWWRDLGPRQPLSLWFNYLLLHRIEALVRVTHTNRLDSLQLALLRILAAADGVGASTLDSLCIDRQLLGRWLDVLVIRGLLSHREGRLELTEAARSAILTGTFTEPRRERRAFYFVDQRETNQPAHYLHLARPALPLTLQGSDFAFDSNWLEACLHRPLEWKRVHQFPLDVEAVIALPSSQIPAEHAWRAVVLDRPEHLQSVVIRTANGIEGFQVQSEDWKLRADPVFVLNSGWEAVLPELQKAPSPESWQTAWQAWCRQRSLPPSETDACEINQQDSRLVVRAPKRLLERLRAGRSDVLHGDTWLLGGTGRTRAAGLVQIVEGEG
jgi:hypothetical protein